MRKILVLSVFVSFCFSDVYAQNTDSLLLQAKNLIQQDRSVEAVSIYEKILLSDQGNYESYTFLGNYYFLSGQKAIAKADADYQLIQSPNRMQVAHHHDELKAIYFTYLEKADRYLLRALIIKKNDHLEHLVSIIQAYKERIGIVPVSGKKKQ